ncbi:MAG: succinate dehydrogenase/fumarate reductase iron-sulfur subunit [Thermoanaerobaculia bacterium]|nr:MAG: succinate dehydrogenase/fumarate reductase iron-sulfur subunit [Thermoanaerobaculia bacterium]
MKLTLRVWRQPGPDAPGRLVTYELPDVSEHMSFLEMLDVLNERLIEKGEEPIAFDHDCREGICGTCGFMISGVAHGKMPATTVCQLHMRHFRDGEELVLEPWRSKAFPVIRDLIVDRGAFDRIIQAGGYVSINTGTGQDGNALPIPKSDADVAMDAASCIGCGACVAQCPNGAAQLFTAAKVSQLALLPQGQPERWQRVERMVAQLEQEAFGSCTNYGECEAVCPKGVSIDFIAMMNRDWLRNVFRVRRESRATGGAG